ncbi:hypothetical protein BDN72DRAFT_862650 [Pluteus cervinus]|uniref:Uncharacterized protein n=1 Tax=Pluteus cervinus TaxID=181527 RepID=A0ACD3AA05_9AGAR|nr:hypothetical protein BDN72DRAFT_862650 [Pluteus cervinus]
MDYLEDIFNEFASNPALSRSQSDHMHLEQSVEDNSGVIRRFFQVSFDWICQHHRQNGLMSIADGSWPSQEEIEELVDRACGQFVFAKIVVRFVGDETEDPVEMLRLVLEQRVSSFEAIDQLYLVILNWVGEKLDKSDKSRPLELRQAMHNLIMHANYAPSSSLAIAEFWFEKEVTINILARHLQALLVRIPNAHGQVSGNAIQFRYKSFHSFLACPSAPHSFSLAEMNPVSKCLPQLEHIMLNMRAVQTFKPCGQDDCVANSDLLALCRMIARPIDHFIRLWKKQERSRPFSFRILKFLLWLRVMLYGLLSDPSTTFSGAIRALLSRFLPFDVLHI